jgi:thioredoxin reductase (NADPH)
MNKYNADILIIGAGPVGLFGVYQAGFLGMKAIVVDAKEEVGGQLSALYPEKFIYDIPAFPQILAQGLVDRLKEQADQFPAEYLLNRQVSNLIKNPDGSFTVNTTKNDEINVKAIIIAAGAGAFVPNTPPIDGIEKYENKYVHYFIKNTEIFRDKNIVIAGGGDSAVDWAVGLADIAKKIYVVHRRDNFRAAESTVAKMQELSKTDKLELVIPYMLDNIKGDGEKINAILVKSLKGDVRALEADHMLAFFGLARNLGSLENWGFNVNKMHSSIEVELGTYETNIPGVFAAGDVAQYSHKLKLISVGFAEIASSVHCAWKYVFPEKVFHFTHSTSKV